MTKEFSKDQVFQAFRDLYNDDLEGDIYLPSDQPEEIEDTDTSEGYWIRHCSVWISCTQVESALETISELRS
jgi:hypothetical protein